MLQALKEIRLDAVLAFGLSVLLLAFGVSSAANSQDVNVEFDEAVDFSKFKTFVVSEGRVTSKAPALNSPLTKKRLQSELEKSLVKRGLVIAEGQPDLKVSFEFGSARTSDTKTYPSGWRGQNTRVVKVQQSQGTFVVDLHDATNDALVWRSVTSDAEKNPQELADKLDKVAKKSVGSYPPKKKK